MVNYIAVTPQDVHNGISKKKLSLLFLLVLLPLVSAVQIDSGSIVQSVGLNSTLNFTNSFQTDLLIVESNSIYFSNFALLGGIEYITMNLTNVGMTGFNAPYISASSSTSKTITSQLSQAVNATVVVNTAGINCDEVNKVTYANEKWTGSDARNVCQSVTTSGYTFEIDSGSNLLEFELGSTSLSTRIMYLLLGFLALSVMLFAVGGFYIYVKDNFDSINVMEFTKYSVLLLLFTVLIIALITYIIQVI